LKKKMRKKYERKGPTLKERLTTVSRQLEDSERYRQQSIKSYEESYDELKKDFVLIKKQLKNASKTIDAQASEITILRETNLNLVEALNILGRTSRLEVQNRLWNAYDLKPQLIEACSNEKSKDLNNYFDANN